MSVGPRTLLRCTAAVAALGALRWAARDYRAWRALGTGGLPPTVWGWVRVSALRAVAVLPAPATPATPAGAGGTSDLAGRLPARAVPRPRVAPHPVPHRVLDQHAPEDLLELLRRALRDQAGRRGLRVDTSRWERHHEALWLGTDEIAHVHPSDGTSHAVLAPADAEVVVARGWGALHPLAGRGGLPRTYTLLFPPRDADEAERVVTILRAATGWALARRTEPG